MGTHSTKGSMVIMEKVYFKSKGLTLAGNIFKPADFNAKKKYPAVVVTGSWTTVKEQMAGLYADRLAENGFIALAFDFRCYGESEGEPRNYESPEAKIIDIKNAVACLQTLPYANADKIAGLGICASAGYMARAVSEDRRIKSLALVAPWLHDGEIVKAVYGGDEGVKERIREGNKAREKFEKTGVCDYVAACSDTNPTAAMYGPFDYYLNKNRGAIKEWANRFAIMSWPEWLMFNPMPTAEKIRVPVLFVHSEGAAIPDGAKKFFGQIPAPKDFLWIQGSQFDFYDQEPQVTKSIHAVVNHFELTLK